MFTIIKKYWILIVILSIFLIGIPIQAQAEIDLWRIPGVNYEKAHLKWDANVFKIGTEAGGVGTAVRLLHMRGANIILDPIAAGAGNMVGIGEQATLDLLGNFILELSVATPGILFNDLASGVNLKKWGIYANSGQLLFTVIDDAESSFTSFMTVTRQAGSPTQPDIIYLLTPLGKGILFNASSFGTNARHVIGIGSGVAPTTSPADMVQLWSADQGGVAGKAAFYVRDETGKVTSIGEKVTIPNKVTVSVPAASPTVSVCGTDPSLATGSNDYAGKITVGTGTVNSCTLTFGAAFTNTPSCVVTGTGAILLSLSAESNTAITIAGTAIQGTNLNYHCVGLNE